MVLLADLCSVTHWGARCDNTTDDTMAIQRALDACAYSVVTFPKHQTCLSFPLKFHNGTSVYLPIGARLKANPDIHRWPPCPSSSAHVTPLPPPMPPMPPPMPPMLPPPSVPSPLPPPTSLAEMCSFVEMNHMRDIVVYGEGTIDGSGEGWWFDEKFNDVRPRLFHMADMRNVSFRGVTLTHSAGMTLVFNSPCFDALVDGVTIYNPAVGQTDGIDMACDGALIQNTAITNGDDSICMKSGAKNVLVRNCTVSNGPAFPGTPFPGLAGGLVLGTSDWLHEDDAIHNVTYSNCTVTGSSQNYPPPANRQLLTANRQPPTANRQPPTANRQPPTAATFHPEPIPPPLPPPLPRS